MKKVILIFTYYIIIFFNSNVFSKENNQSLKIGLLAPLTGEYKDLGNSLMYSLQLALEEIGDDKVFIIPKDSGLNDKEKLNKAIQDIKSEGANIVIGPIDNKDFNEVKKYNDLIFISPSNMSPDFTNNIISIGISLESQLIALFDFLKKQKKKKTVILFPKNQYAKFVESKLKKFDLKKTKIFQYSPDPKILTGEIENLTNYTQRKRNLELRKKMFEDRDDEQSTKELERLEQLYTLGNVNFDSVIIIDFGNNLKSVLTSLVYTDVNQKNVLFTTVNQWFDESIFYENTIKTIYYPSISYKEFTKRLHMFYKIFTNTLQIKFL